MADPTAPKSQPPLQKKRAVQRCPNCDIRCDVSLFVDGSLARCGHCGVRFEVHRERTPPPPQQQPKAPDGPFPRLDGFLVHERIGQGGMGEVFRCTRNSDGLPVAVKILTAQMAAVPDYVRRFGREAAAMAQLDHPGIVRLLGRGKAGQHVYIAMELIEGESLRTWAHRIRPTARDLAALLAQVAHALAYAHARAVVHRDLKPDNVLVTRNLTTKVLDFGLAGLHAEGAECLTQSHVSMGTANYMAPEQRKDAKRADHKADIYSFGVMTYELLTGELPVGKFAAPSKAVPGLDPRWDTLIERCLEPHPLARPHSALELAHALEALSGRAAPLELAPRTRKNAARSGMWSWLGLGTAVAVLACVVGLRMSEDHKAPPPAPAAARPLANRAPRR
ncbi:MAG TPA: serine/threonine-protein kinase [Myxococcales bacterium]|nr:serine/threonine-protein kinase [Myxococcales bacterium]